MELKQKLKSEDTSGSRQNFNLSNDKSFFHVENKIICLAEIDQILSFLFYFEGKHVSIIFKFLFNTQHYLV